MDAADPAPEGAGVPAPSAEALYWTRLEAAVRARAEALDGVAGVCLLDVRGGRVLRLNADLTFAIPSSIKVPILCALLRAAQRGAVSLTARRTLLPSELVGGSGALHACLDPVELSVRDLARWMIVHSDNSATNACIDLAGGIAAVNALLDELGLARTRLRRKMMDGEAAARGEENVSTPGEMAALLRVLADESGHDGGSRPAPDAQAAALPEPVRAAALEVLCLPKGGAFSPLARRDMPVASKPGAIEGLACDVGYFFQRRRPFALAVMAGYARHDPSGWVRDLARTIADAMAVLDGTLTGGRRLAPEPARPSG